MNRTVNNILFVLGATIFIFLLITILFFALFIPVVLFLIPNSSDPSIGMLVMVVVFVLSVGGAFIIYNKVIKLVMNKFNLEKYIGSGKR
ncbi:MAG: leader peptide processing enzyme [Spirochaetales bacterium]|nr:leader peptide processing enzyme [Spirochaetales bacterium]